MFVVVSCCHAQTEKIDSSNYCFTQKKEWLIIGGASLTAGIAAWMYTTTDPLQFKPSKEIQRINRIDRKYMFNPDQTWNKRSDYLMYGSALFPMGALLASSYWLNKVDDRALIYTETMLSTMSLVFLSKYSFRRVRPYAFAVDDRDLTYFVPSGDQNSFVSGHTAFASANLYSMFFLYQDVLRSTKWYYPALFLTASFPAIVGYSRVVAGKHFVSDVIAGYALGAVVSWGVERLHRCGKHVKIWSSSNALGLQVVF